MVLVGMSCIIVVLATLCCVLVCGSRFARDAEDKPCGETDGSLFLTQYVENGDINRARTESKVSLLADDITDTHSGYITINKTANTNLFFMLVKKQHKAGNQTSPLLLWLQGGPGSSSLFGHFVENGPFGVDGYGKLYRRNHTLCQLFDVVYLDQPVGAGYSFTDDLDNGFAKTIEDMSATIVEFLRQFLVLFPEYLGKELYIAGESYGSRPALATAYKLHQEPGALRLTLKGLINGVGFWSSIVQSIDVSSYFKALGLLDHNGYETFSERVSNISVLVRSGKHWEASMLLARTFWSSSNKSDPTLYQRLTGYDFDGNILEAKEPPVFTRFKELATKPEFKKAIHVGRERPYRAYDSYIHGNLIYDFFRDLGDMATVVLDNYKILVYVGQLDPTFALDRTEDFFRNLSWNGNREFRAAQHKIWYINEDDVNSAGYVTQIRNFTYVTLARAGHYPAFDEPRAATNMFFRFVSGCTTAQME